MKTTCCILLMMFSVFSLAQKEFRPEGSTVIETVEGDLDGDEIPEKVIIYNTKDTTEYGNIRDIQILKRMGNQWKILDHSRTAILEGNHRGDMENYLFFTIKNGILMIEHSGGNSWKWNSKDKYRYQNGRFELIGVTYGYGRAGIYSTFDFNLSTGKLIYRKEVNKGLYDDLGKPESEIFYKRGLITSLKDRNKDHRDITLPETKALFTL